MTQDQIIDSQTTQHKRVICIAIFALALLLGTWLRFYQIGIKPLHHDEGVNSFFLLNLAHGRGYAYNPHNYHGPTLYYFAILSLWTLGETDFALRFWPAIFGSLIIALLWWLRNELGLEGIAAAALLVALSPGLVYFSRDFIHEMLFGCFTLGTVVGAWRYAATKKFAWLALMATSAGLLFATKETAIITAGVLIIAAFSAAIWDISRRLILTRQFTLSVLARELWGEVWQPRRLSDFLIEGGTIFVIINVLLYSSFFTNPSGVTDAVRSIFLWSGRQGHEHVHDFDYYFGILFKLELPLLVGAIIGGILIIWRGTRFGLFLGAWTLGIFLAYSLIPYKTPWLIVNVLVPLALTSGYAVAEIYRMLPSILPRFVWIAVCFMACVLSWQMAWRVNFRFYDDNSNSSSYLTKLGERLKWRPYMDGQYGYVYAQTDRELLKLVASIDEAAERLLTREKTGIYLASPAYWPLPWYLRRYTNVAYTGNLSNQPNEITQPLLIANVTQQTAIEQAPEWHAVTPPLLLRPGEQLILYVRD